MTRDWSQATPDEIRDARIQALEEGLDQLHRLVVEALQNGRNLPGAAEILEEEWGK